MRTLLLVLLMVSAPVGAEIEKHGRPCEAGICLYWWPKLPAVHGWHQELGPSEHYSVNTLAPDGSTFMDAETVMYAKASYKPRVPETKSVEALIESDKQDFKTNVPGVVIAEVASLTTADGKKLRSFTYFPTIKGNWERVSYGEEDDFYLIFSVSSRTESGYKKAAAAYEGLIRAYKQKLSSKRGRVELFQEYSNTTSLINFNAPKKKTAAVRRQPPRCQPQMVRT